MLVLWGYGSMECMLHINLLNCTVTLMKMVDFTYGILPQCNSMPTTLTLIFLSNLEVLFLLKNLIIVTINIILAIIS